MITVNVPVMIGLFVLTLMAGAFFGALVIIGYSWKWINADPDGPGGYRSRMEQLGQVHSDKDKNEDNL